MRGEQRAVPLSRVVRRDGFDAQCRAVIKFSFTFCVAFFDVFCFFLKKQCYLLVIEYYNS